MRGLKVNACKRKVMVMIGDHLEYVSEYKYLGCVLDESGTGGTEFSRKVAGAIRYLVNARDLQIECVSLARNIACTCSYVWQ